MTYSKDLIVKIIIGMAAAYPNFQIRKDTITVYVEMLKDIPPEELDRAAKLVLVRSKFFPTIAEIREAVAELRTEGQRAGILSAVDAWNSVLEQVRFVGSYGSPKFADPITARIVAGMGWNNICMSENQMADRAHFLKMYNDLSGVVTDQMRRPPELQADINPMITSGVNRLISAYTGEVEVLE